MRDIAGVESADCTTSPGSATASPAPRPATIHRSSEPGHWIVAFPWQERGRAEAIADAAVRFAIAGLAPTSAETATRNDERRIARAVERIAAAATDPPTWIRDPERRVPTVSITGTNGKSTTTRMITHIFRAAGRHTGTAVSDGVLIDETMVEEGDLTGPCRRPDGPDRSGTWTSRSSRRPGAVCCFAASGYESNDASVITNVSSDHLDLQGIHTLPELAEVKSIIARMTRPLGVVVLNAEDPLVSAMSRHVRARVCFFAVDPSRPPARARLARHARDGGGLRRRRGRLDRRAERRPEARRSCRRSRSSTLGGVARHNVANALAAAAAARALGASPEQVADGLRSFVPTADVMPGRMNLYRSGDRLAIIDFAHNEAGLSTMLDVAARAHRGRRSGCGRRLGLGRRGDRR